MNSHLTKDELRRYFSGGDPSPPSSPRRELKEINFGEYLVDRSLITRAQLLEALQLQDKNPGVRLGECIAALGILRHDLLEESVRQYRNMNVIEV